MDRSIFRYHPFYCEENVWHLCRDGRIEGAAQRVVFVSNRARQVAMWQQRSAPAPQIPVVWDYHVVLWTRASADWRVWDLDCSLPLGVPLETWLGASFRPRITPPQLLPMFRCVEADAYARVFASDRRQMRDEHGMWISPPPPWPPIGTGHNLERFIDMNDDAWLGVIASLEALREGVSDVLR